MNTFKTIKTNLINKYFPNKNWIEDSVVGNAVNKAFELAWERGRANGEEAIDYEFKQIIEIIKPLI